MKKTKIKNKIYHGPINVSGSGGYISKYLRTKGYVSDFIVWYDLGRRRNSDYNLQLKKYNLFKKLILIFLNFLMAFTKYDIFHFYYGKSLLPYGLDLPFLKLFGKKIIMTYCGSEVRLVGYVESKRNPYAYLLKIGSNHLKYDDRKVRMIKWHNLWCNKIIAYRDCYDSAIFVADKKKVIKYPWIQNLTSHKKNFFNIPDKIKTNKIPTIVHAPTNQLIKGTKYIEKAIKNLKKKGLKFNYLRVEKKPNQIAQEIYKKADIIVDQLLLGSFGTLAVEGMSYGKPVISYLLDDIRIKNCPDCPIYSANIDNIENRLEELIKDKNLRIELGKKGVKFVKKNLDNEIILKKMEKIYEKL
jgi:glycosyltransferase involved in cell wall biosynthesis